MNATPARQIDTGDAVMSALGSDVRRDIVRLLADQPMTTGEIARQFPISRPAISKHLRLLSEAGLITHEAHGRFHQYRLARAGFADGHAWLDQFWPDALRRFQMVAENTYQADPDV